MRFEAYVAARYLRGKRKNRFVNLIGIISVAGVCVGVITLIVVMSVMTGFDIELMNTIVGNRSHLTVYARGESTIGDWEKAIQDVSKQCPQIVAASPMITVEALLRNGESTTGALILGCDPQLQSKVTDLEKNLSNTEGRTFGRGELPKEKEIVLGYRLANRINASVGDEVVVFTARSTVKAMLGKQMGTPVWLRVSGISQARMSDFDELYSFVDLATARMLKGQTGVDGIQVKLSDPFEADAVCTAIRAARLPYTGQTWYQDQEAFFEALKQEKLVMFIILAFIVLVAAFNITSTLIMIVMEKRRDIGILRTLGSSGGSILLLFILQGLMIGLSGAFLGTLIGAALAYNLNPIAEFLAGLLGVDLFNSTIYYFDHIPVKVVPRDVFWITFSAVVLTFLSTLYPAWSASRVNPVDALRYE